MDFQPGDYFASSAINYLKRQSEGFGVVTGLTVTASTASLAVIVDTGTAFVGYGTDSSFFNLTQSETLSLNSNDYNPIKVAIEMTSEGVVTMTYGTASGAIPDGGSGRTAQYPFMPTIETDSILLAEVWIPGAATDTTGLLIYNVDKIAWPKKHDSGYATISSGSNSVIVPHILTIEPTMVYVMGDHTDTSAWFISDRTTASFTINLPITGTTDLRTVSWNADAI